MYIKYSFASFVIVSSHASTCSDFGSDSDACLSHKDKLHVSTCTFCVTDQQCHEVGSVVNPCTNACCASLATLSTCSNSAVETVDANACSGIWKAEAFAPGINPLGGISANDISGGGTPWPEEGRTNGAGTSAHFSGGGSRAMALGIAQARGIRRLNFMGGVEYLVGVSGGSWFASAYTYDQRSSVDDDTRLCPYVEPTNLTSDFLADTPSGCLLALPQCGLYECLVEEIAKGALDPFYTVDRAWVDCTGRCYLEPLGIPLEALFSFEDSDVAGVKASNPTLANETFLLPVQASAENDARPYLIMGGTLVGPASLNPFAVNKTYVPLELAPLASGAALTQVVPYVPASSSSSSPVPVKVGGLIGTYAFGLSQSSAGPVVEVNASTGQGDGDVEAWVPGINGSPGARLGLSRAAGISSMAAEGLLSQITGSTVVLVEEEVWPVDGGSSGDDDEGAYSTMLVGDGGLMENFGVVAALRRQVPRLAVHVNTEQALASPNVWDPFDRAPTEDEIDGYLSALFGVQVYSSTGPEANMYWTFNNQVFPTEAFAPLASALQQAALGGGGAVATTTLTTVANEFLGIPAGVPVLVTWNYLSTATAWVAQLPAEIQDDLAAGDQGPYKGFPHYSTADISLTASQVNLLANMATWVVEHNEDAYAQIFAQNKDWQRGSSTA